ncbi:hypothetical protein ACNKHW_23535 [Shigella flexneri]
MDSQRNLLFIALLLVSFFAWQTWESDQARALTPLFRQRSRRQRQVVAKTRIGQKQIFTVKTDMYNHLNINLRGGDIDEADLFGLPGNLKSANRSVTGNNS